MERTSEYWLMTFFCWIFPFRNGIKAQAKMSSVNEQVLFLEFEWMRIEYDGKRIECKVWMMMMMIILQTINWHH